MKKILFVDDEEMLREIGQEMLTDLGYEVLLACDGEEAIAVFKANKEEISLVILDMIMPKLNGEEAYQEILRIDPEARIIISSGYSKDGQTSSVLKESDCIFLQKPYDYEDMEEKINQALGQ